MAAAKPIIDEKKLTRWKLLDDFRRRLAKIQAKNPKPPSRPGGPERLLLEEDYFSLMLFGLFNPVIGTMRGLCAAPQARPRGGVRTSGELGEFFRSAGRVRPGAAPAGVTWQGRVKLGDKWQGEPMRVVKVEVDGKTLLLATDLEMEAELIALIYRYRWQVELFFKWLKSILGCRHLMAESPDGVAIQI